MDFKYSCLHTELRWNQTAFWEIYQTLFHIAYFDDISILWAVIGLDVAAVGIAAGPVRSLTVLQRSAAFLSTSSGVAGLFDWAAAV